MEANEPGAYGRIAGLLRAAAFRTRTRRIRVALGLGLLGSGGAALVCALLARPARPWALALPPLVLAVAARLWPLPGQRAAVAALALSDLSLRSALRSAVELHPFVVGGDGLSVRLVEAHAAATAGRLGEVDLSRALPAPFSRIVLVAGLVLVAADFLLARFGLAPIAAGFAGTPSASRAGLAREPITGDIELTYLYPAHTHLPPRTVTGTDGAITAPAGTQVRVRTRADRPVVAAAAVINGVAAPLSVSSGRDLSGTLICRKAGSYVFRFLDARGRTLAEGPPMPIVLQADLSPTVVIDAPRQKSEVDPKAVVSIRWHASDDYGLSEVALIFRTPGSPAERRVLLEKAPQTPTRLSGEASFDLAPLHLSPGDTVSYTVEALDNDDVSGPKSGRAAAHTLDVFSAVEHHREAIAAVRVLWEKVVLLLADRIDEKIRTAPSPAGADSRALTLCDQLERMGRKLRREPSGPAGLAAALLAVATGERARASETLDAREALRRPWNSPEGGARLAVALAAEITGLERDVPYLERLLDEQTLRDLFSLQKELSSRRAELAKLIETYREKPTPELRAAILAQLARFRERLTELQAREAELAKGITDEHFNRRALAQVAKEHDVGKGLQDIEQRLARGDVEGAMKALDEMGSSLDRMQDDFQQLAGEAGQRYPGLARKLQAFQRDVDAAADEERRLSQETDGVREQAREAAARRASASRALVRELARQAAEAEEELSKVPDETLPRGLFGEDALGDAREAAGTLRKALEASDLDEARTAVGKALPRVEELQGGLSREEAVAREWSGPGGALSPPGKLTEARRHARGALRPLQDIRDALDRLFRAQEAALSPAARQRLGQLAGRQERLREHLGQVRRDMKAVEDTAPLFGPSAQEQIEGAGAQMGEAASSLRGRRPGSAVEHEESALQNLETLRQAAKAGKGQGGGIPLPMISGDDEGGGDTGEPAPGEKVVIPRADQYQVPPEFRRDILDAMRQAPPRQYEEEVKKYYREIVR